MGSIPFPRAFVRKWTKYRDWSTNSLPTIPQSIVLTITPRGHPHFSFVDRRMLSSLSTRLPRLSSAWLALLILVSISQSKEPSQNMVLPRYLKCSTLASGFSSIVMVGEGCMVQVGGAPLYFQDWFSSRRAWMPRRSDPASAASLVLRGPLVRSRQQRTSWRRVCRLFDFAVSRCRSKKEPSMR